MESVLTLDKLQDMTMKLHRLREDTERAGAPREIIITVHARERIPGEWNFKPSRNRSPRLHKKLLKRFGTQERMKPAILVLGPRMLVHPALWARVRAQLQATAVDYREPSLLVGAELFGIPVRGGW